jgi:hypothetical protein
MMRDAGVMRAGATEKGPAVDNEGPAAHRAQVRGPEAPRCTAAQEDCIELPVIISIHVDDRLMPIARGKSRRDLLCPAANGPPSVADIDHGHCSNNWRKSALAASVS